MQSSSNWVGITKKSRTEEPWNHLKTTTLNIVTSITFVPNGVPLKWICCCIALLSKMVWTKGMLYVLVLFPHRTYVWDIQKNREERRILQISKTYVSWSIKHDVLQNSWLNITVTSRATVSCQSNYHCYEFSRCIECRYIEDWLLYFGKAEQWHNSTRCSGIAKLQKLTSQIHIQFSLHFLLKWTFQTCIVTYRR